MAPRNGTSHPPPNHSTLQWHPAMAPHPLVQSWSSPSPPPTIAHYNDTLQWHHIHSTIAHYNGTLQLHPAIAPRPLPQSQSSPSSPNHSTLQWHPTMAPTNGTTSTAPCNGTLVPRPIRQSGSSPSPLLEVRTPIAIAIWGKILEQDDYSIQTLPKLFHKFSIVILHWLVFLWRWLWLSFPTPNARVRGPRASLVGVPGQVWLWLIRY